MRICIIIMIACFSCLSFADGLLSESRLKHESSQGIVSDFGLGWAPNMSQGPSFDSDQSLALFKDFAELSVVLAQETAELNFSQNYRIKPHLSKNAEKNALSNWIEASQIRLWYIRA